jgi:hypothetical protein
MTYTTIECLWAFVAENVDTQNGQIEEGICAFMHEGAWFPMIAHKQERVDQLTPVAREISERSGHPIKLVEFHRTDERMLRWH